MKVVVLLAVVAAAAVAAWQPRPDVPYEEIVATRMAAPGVLAAPQVFSLPGISHLFPCQSPPRFCFLLLVVLLLSLLLQWPALPVAVPVQALATTLAGTQGALLMAPDGTVSFVYRQPGTTGSDGFVFSAVEVTLGAGCRMGADTQGAWTVAACAGSLSAVECQGPFPTGITCGVRPLLSGTDWITVTAVLATDAGVYIGSSEGLFFVAAGQGAPVALMSDAVQALSSGVAGTVYAAAPTKVYQFARAALLRFDWSSNSAQGMGGVYDETVRTMAFASGSGKLFLGTDSFMNIQEPDGAVLRYAGLDGLPHNLTTSMALSADQTLLWVGTQMGAARWNMTSNTWRYFYGNRYLPGDSNVSQVVTISPTLTLAVTDGGLSFLASETWTLAQKADHYDQILLRHDRHGLVSDCPLASFGDSDHCQNTDRCF
jgi:hypothetical protein